MVLTKKILKHTRQKTLFKVIKNKIMNNKLIRMFNSRYRLWVKLKKKGDKYITFNLSYPNCYSCKINLDFDNAISEKIFLGNYEPNEIAFVSSFLREGDVFIDIGANVGLFSVVAGHKVGDKGEVHAFEPVLKLFDRIQYNIELNHLKNVKCHQLALTDLHGDFDITVYLDGYEAWSTLAKPILKDNIKYITNKIKAETLDRLMLEGCLPKNVDLIKIDVEGWELKVLRGGSELFSRHDAPVIIIEFTSVNALEAGTSCHEVYHLLEKYGYNMYLYDGRRNVLIHDPIRDHYPYNNLIAIKSVKPVLSCIGATLL